MKISTLGFFSSIAFVVGALLAGCSGDTINTSDLFTLDGGGDATTRMAADGGCANGTSCGGACVETGNDPANCGGCGNVCATGDVCSMGGCAPSCAAGTTACNGACVNTSSDGSNCNACGTVCPSGTMCNSGACSPTCNGGSSACGNDCDNLQSDPNNCGACGNVCGAGQVCSLGVCGTTCAAGLAICPVSRATSGDAGDAGVGGATNICTDETSDPNHCGTCSTVCPTGELCSNGQCATSCLAGLIQCGSTCVDPTSNDNYCGATLGCGSGDAGGSMGVVCSGGQVCTTGPNGTGICATTCGANEVNCGGTCVDPTASLTHCGAKGDCEDGMGAANSAGASCLTANGATQGEVCSKNASGASVCAVSCLPGEVNCGGICVDPKTSFTNCGATLNCGANGSGVTGTSCAVAAGQSPKVCNDGTCQTTCPQGLIDCNGICVDPETNSNFCGAQGTCSAASGVNSKGTVCAAGSFCSGGAVPDDVPSRSGQLQRYLRRSEDRRKRLRRFGQLYKWQRARQHHEQHRHRLRCRNGLHRDVAGDNRRMRGGLYGNAGHVRHDLRRRQER